MALPPKDSWWIVLFRHFTSIMALLAAVWWLALPRIEVFIQNAVNDRLVRVETSLDVHGRQLQSIIEKLEIVKEKQDEPPPQ